MTMRMRQVENPQPDPPAQQILALCVPALDCITPDILTSVSNALRANGFESACDDVQIALAEALNNIVEHAYAGQTKGAMNVVVSASTKHLDFCLTDWGQALPGEQLPDADLPDACALAEGGYGWFLIQTLMTQVQYARTAHSNRLHLRLSL